MQKLKSCGVLVFRDDPEPGFLLMKHPDRFDLPKGHIDAQESETECALREMAEETGIPADAVQLDSRFRFTARYTVRSQRTEFRPAEKTLVIFLARLLRPVEIRPTEHESFTWVRWNPPHQIQLQTIDPLLAQLAKHFAA